MGRAVALGVASSGREREVGLLLREHEEARERGAARFAFVRGPAGIGKSYLFRELRRALLGRGVRVFEGHASRTAPRVYGLFASLAPDLLAHLSETGVPGRTVSDLSRRLSPLFDGCPTPAGPVEEHRLDLCDATADLFALGSQCHPVFLFSDADAADKASLNLLRYLAAATLSPGARAGGLYVVSYRDDGPLPAPLLELIARTPALSLPLQPLDLEGVRQFLTSAEVAERLLEATRGIPTALEAVVSGAPSQPADLFARCLSRLDAEDREVLLALAVLGGPTPFDLLERVLCRARGEPLKSLGARLERLARERFLEARPSTDHLTYAIASEAWHQGVLDAASAAELSRLHLAAGEELAERGVDPERAVRHLLVADPKGRGAREALRAAERLAARSAFDEAADLFRQALDGLPPDEHGPVHARLAQVLRGCGDLVGALRHLGLARRGAPAHRLRALRGEAASLAMRLGRLPTAERLLRKVLGEASLPSRDDPVGMAAFADWAEVLFLRGQYAAARQACEQGLEAFADDVPVALSLRNVLGKVFLAQADYAAAEAAFAQNAELARKAGRPRDEAGALINQGAAAHRRGQRREAIDLYRAGLALCGSDRGLAAFALSNLGSLYADSAELEPAVEHLSRALAAFTRAGRAKEVAHAALNLARLHLFLGDLERAGLLCEHAEAVSSEVGDPYLCASARLVRGELLEARGALGEALTELAQAQEMFEAIASPRYAAEAALARARLHLARGELALSRGALDCPAVDQLARTSPAIAAERELIAGELALVRSDLPEATRALSRAKEILLQSPDLEGPYRVYHLLSRLRAAAGDPAGAAADAARAARLLDELAARVPSSSRAQFLRLRKRALVLAAGAEHEITPAHVTRALSLEPEPPPHDRPLIGQAPSLQKIFKVLDAVARSDATVLLRGESGTGKELLAEAIHKRSRRKDMPLVKVNCAAMVEDLLLSELFGHEKGAFTGAIRERKGRFELAEGGTIFLDEIGDISAKAQVALLRVLQEREFERVGGQKTLRVDVRVICATNRDLEAMIAAGSFREDLYYRLKEVMLELPPLRERLEDLPLLCEHLLGRLARQRQEEKKSLSPQALELLRRYPFPGNVRELENVLSAAAIFAPGRVITPEAFETIAELAPLVEGAARDREQAPTPGSVARAEPDRKNGEPIDYYALARERGIGLKELREEMEAQCILRALAEARGNISEAARLLHLKRSRLSQIVNADPRLRAAAKN